MWPNDDPPPCRKDMGAEEGSASRGRQPRRSAVDDSAQRGWNRMLNWTHTGTGVSCLNAGVNL